MSDDMLGDAVRSLVAVPSPALGTVKNALERLAGKDHEHWRRVFDEVMKQPRGALQTLAIHLDATEEQISLPAFLAVDRNCLAPHPEDGASPFASTSTRIDGRSEQGCPKNLRKYRVTSPGPIGLEKVRAVAGGDRLVRSSLAPSQLRAIANTMREREALGILERKGWNLFFLRVRQRPYLILVGLKYRISMNDWLLKSEMEGGPFSPDEPLCIFIAE